MDNATTEVYIFWPDDVTPDFTLHWRRVTAASARTHDWKLVRNPQIVAIALPVMESRRAAPVAYDATMRAWHELRNRTNEAYDVTIA